METKYILFSVLFFISTMAVFAQENVEVTVAPKEMSQGTQMAFTVFIPESSPKMVEKQWKNFINERSIFEFATKGTSQTFEKAFIGISNIFSKEKKSFTKNSLKVEKIGDELVVRNVIHEELTSNHIDVFATIAGTKEGVYLNSFLKFSDSIFIDKTNISEDALSSIQNYVRVFGVETYRKVVEEQIVVENKELNRQEGILKNLEKKNKSLHNGIGRYEAEIDEFYSNINMIGTDLQRIEEQILGRKKSLQQTNRNSLEYDSIKDDIKESESERKRRLKDVKRQKNKIKRNQTKIRDSNSDIRGNEKEQEFQREKINMQEMRVSNFESKLANIK